MSVLQQSHRSTVFLVHGEKLMVETTPDGMVCIRQIRHSPKNWARNRGMPKKYVIETFQKPCNAKLNLENDSGRRGIRGLCWRGERQERDPTKKHSDGPWVHFEQWALERRRWWRGWMRVSWETVPDEDNGARDGEAIAQLQKCRGRYQSEAYCWKNENGGDRQLWIISFNSLCVVFHHVLQKHCPAIARQRPEFISSWWRAIIMNVEGGDKSSSGIG